MEITKKYHKTNTICNWKYKGVIYHDFDSLYEIYINTMNCTHCGKEFPNIKDRCLDHDHETGHFRKIVCQRCNSADNYIKYPNGIPSEKQRRKWTGERMRAKEETKIYLKKWREENRDMIREKARAEYTCECGAIMRLDSKAKHEKTKIHIRLMEQLN